MRIDHNMRAFERALSDAARKQLPFAVSLALNEVAGAIKSNTVSRLHKDLDRPTPFTQRGVFISRASKRKLSAVVGFKDIQARYLRIQETGGVRRPKARAIVVPVAQRLNKYGNMPRNTIKRALARPDTFSGKVGNTPGVFQRKKRGGLKMLAAYEKRANYTKRMDFEGNARKTATKRIPFHMKKAMTRAMATRR